MRENGPNSTGKNGAAHTAPLTCTGKRRCLALEPTLGLGFDPVSLHRQSPLPGSPPAAFRACRRRRLPQGEPSILPPARLPTPPHRSLQQTVRRSIASSQVGLPTLFCCVLPLCLCPAETLPCTRRGRYRSRGRSSLCFRAQRWPSYTPDRCRRPRSCRR